MLEPVDTVPDVYCVRCGKVHKPPVASAITQPCPWKASGQHASCLFALGQIQAELVVNKRNLRDITESNEALLRMVAARIREGYGDE